MTTHVHGQETGTAPPAWGPHEHLEAILVAAARHNNLKGVHARIPKGAVTAVTGVSGSGKSSLVHGVIAAEAGRRLNETFPGFLRNRLPKLARHPDPGAVRGLPPAVVVDQGAPGANSRSTVGTMTGVLAALRVLYSRCASPSAGESTAYSFNDPAGMCPECQGLGRTVRVDPDRVLDPALSLNQGAILAPIAAVGTATWQIYAESGLFDPDKPVGAFTGEERELLLHGGGFRVERRGPNGTYRNTYEGLVPMLERRYLNRDTSRLRGRDRRAALAAVHEGPCPECGGARLNAAARASRLAGMGIADMCALEVPDLAEVLAGLADPVAAAAAGEALASLRRIERVGLGYLRLDRESGTLSGGEAQRLKVVRHLGTGLAGMAYVFDEPSRGLHPRDVHRLIGLLYELREEGNTVLVVEHDRQVVRAADHVIDMGPGAGAAGGRVVFAGAPSELEGAATATGEALRTPAPLKRRVRTPSGAYRIKDARLNNLDGVSTDLPAGVLTAVTGVAGSGKSSLVRELARLHPEAVVVDQSPIPASPRATVATHLKVMDRIRRLFADASGADPSLFSANSAGACPRCKGRGTVSTDLAFMDPVVSVCETCGGLRFRPEALEHKLAGRTVAQMLDATAAEAAPLLDDTGVRRRLARLEEVGLDHLTLGRELASLSGGERQRLKLARHLGESGALYVFDEPTAGLHPADVEGLAALLDRLVDTGNTVVVVEHDLDLVRRADHVIDMGPGGGRHGGRVVFEGSPADLAEAEGSSTAEFLRREEKEAGAA